MVVFKTAPRAVAERTSTLAARLRLARKRRGITIAELAAKTGLNRNTVNALELGKPGVALGALLRVLWVLGLEQTLDGVANPDFDSHGKALEASRRPKRVRKLKTPNEYEF